MVDIKQVKVRCTICGHQWIPRKKSVDKCTRCQKKGVVELVIQTEKQNYNEAIANHNERG